MLMAAVGVFYREGLQAPSQPARSAMGWYYWGKGPWLPQKKEGEAQMRRNRGGIELWEVEGTHFSLGKKERNHTLGGG